MTSPSEYHTRGAKQRTVITKLVTNTSASNNQSYEERSERSLSFSILKPRKFNLC